MQRGSNYLSANRKKKGKKVQLVLRYICQITNTENYGFRYGHTDQIEMVLSVNVIKIGKRKSQGFPN